MSLASLLTSDNLRAASGSAFARGEAYWREVSDNKINLAGSRTVGWYALPEARSGYISDFGRADLSKLAQHCSAAADADVDFPQHTNVNFVFDQNLDCCAWGGGLRLSLDGQTKVYGATWMPPWGWRDQGVLAHELGHSFGMPHSSGPYNQTYDSQWDGMSDATGTCTPKDPTYGCVGGGHHLIPRGHGRVGSRGSQVQRRRRVYPPDHP